MAIAIAPMLPLLLLLFSLTLTIRRLVDRRAYPLAFVALFFAGSAIGMFMPTRIDHHGWQLALLSLAVAGIADPKRARGGAVTGIASAMSLCDRARNADLHRDCRGGDGAVLGYRSRTNGSGLSAYAVSLGGGTAVGFLVFASYANRLPVCDALSPVWLSDALLGSALLFGLALLSPASWKRAWRLPSRPASSSRPSMPWRGRNA